MVNGKGVSAIFAVVLMILIVVAGVGIVWGVLLPLLNTDVGLSENAVSIDTEGGHTLYDEVSKIACVQISRNDEEIDGMKILFVMGGDSHTVSIEKDDLPEVNGKKRYCVDLTSYDMKPTSVSVFAVKGGIDGVASSTNMPDGTLTDDTLDNLRSGSGGGLRNIDDDPANPANVVCGDGECNGDETCGSCDDCCLAYVTGQKIEYNIYSIFANRRFIVSLDSGICNYLNDPNELFIQYENCDAVLSDEEFHRLTLEIYDEGDGCYVLDDEDMFEGTENVYCDYRIATSDNI